MTQDALDRALQTDRGMEAAIARCRAEAATLDRRLREAARTNPRALEQVLDIELFRTGDGEVRGYFGEFWLPHWDAGLNRLISQNTAVSLRRCNGLAR